MQPVIRAHYNFLITCIKVLLIGDDDDDDVRRFILFDSKKVTAIVMPSLAFGIVWFSYFSSLFYFQGLESSADLSPCHFSILLTSLVKKKITSESAISMLHSSRVIFDWHFA